MSILEKNRPSKMSIHCKYRIMITAKRFLSFIICSSFSIHYIKYIVDFKPILQPSMIAIQPASAQQTILPSMDFELLRNSFGIRSAGLNRSLSLANALHTSTFMIKCTPFFMVYLLYRLSAWKWIFNTLVGCILSEIKAHKTIRFKKIEPIFHCRKRDP